MPVCYPQKKRDEKLKLEEEERQKRLQEKEKAKADAARKKEQAESIAGEVRSCRCTFVLLLQHTISPATVWLSTESFAIEHTHLTRPAAACHRHFR